MCQVYVVLWVTSETIHFDPIKILTHYAPQNEHQNLSFVKDKCKWDEKAVQSPFINSVSFLNTLYVLSNYSFSHEIIDKRYLEKTKRNWNLALQKYPAILSAKNIWYIAQPHFLIYFLHLHCKISKEISSLIISLDAQKCRQSKTWKYQKSKKFRIFVQVLKKDVLQIGNTTPMISDFLNLLGQKFECINNWFVIIKLYTWSFFILVFDSHIMMHYEV